MEIYPKGKTKGHIRVGEEVSTPCPNLIPEVVRPVRGGMITITTIL